MKDIKDILLDALMKMKDSKDSKDSKENKKFYDYEHECADEQCDNFTQADEFQYHISQICNLNTVSQIVNNAKSLKIDYLKTIMSASEKEEIYNEVLLDFKDSMKIALKSIEYFRKSYLEYKE